MKKSKTALIFILAFTALIQSGCSRGEQNVSVFLNQLQVPVLKYRDNNPVLRMKVVNGDSVAKTVTSIKINTAGTDDLDDIKAIRLFFMGKDSLWLRYETVPDKAGNILDPLYDEFSPLQFGQDMKPAPSITFKGEQMLAPGDNYFWVMVELSENASLHNKIDAGCNRMIIGGERPAVPDADPPVRQRIGVAVRKHSDDNVDTYRVPGLATTRKGTL
ncbi:MAG TPA: BNR-repeat neuraminidase N-terminal domain-containing protein, partial [Bacteroidales bacterium]|nr:BNR-repeat neuraminidase N-terminal domain-containing protein [Bacteroidales bacterium]